MNIPRRQALAVALMIAAISPLRAEPQAVQMLNAMRAQQGMAPLSYAPRLEAAARAHALDMARHGYFSHTGRDGSGVGDRVRAQGYRWCYVAENLAKGQGDLTQVMRGWAQSAPHYRNMISRNATAFGLFQGPDRIWAMVLAAPC